MKYSRIRRVPAVAPAMLLVSLVAAICVRAQAPDFSKVEIKTNKIADNFYTLNGAGGTIGVLPGPDGILIVDTEFAPLTEKIVAAIKQISPTPIRFVINTHVHGDHTGGNENFGKLGATIFARPELRDRLMHPNPGPNGQTPTPAPAIALPVVTYTSTITFHLNGETADAIPVPRAHTDGDTMIYFHNADVLMTGDFYRSIGYPNIDRTNGGSLNGMIDGLAAVVALAGPSTKIVPGHGPVVDKKAVAAQREMIIAIRDKVEQMVKQGKTADEVLAAHVTNPYDAEVPPASPNGDRNADRFISQLYAELKQSK
jgi:cyclase